MPPGDVWFATARSNAPSPLKSPETPSIGIVPATKFCSLKGSVSVADKERNGSGSDTHGIVDPIAAKVTHRNPYSNEGTHQKGWGLESAIAVAQENRQPMGVVVRERHSQIEMTVLVKITTGYPIEVPTDLVVGGGK